MIDIVLASDRNLIRQAGITALSAARASSLPVRATFLTPQADADHRDWGLVEAALRKRGVSYSLVPVTLNASRLQLAEHLTAVTYYRLVLPTLLPEGQRRAIYLDCDVIVHRDLAELWSMKMNDMPIAAAPDLNFRDWSRLGIESADGYFNAGVLLLDLHVIRTTGAFESALEFSRENPGALTWSDQCALNRVFTRKWIRLDRHWNYQYSTFMDDIRQHGMRAAVEAASKSVIHFNNYERPWLAEFPHPLKKFYLSVVAANPELASPSSRTIPQQLQYLKRLIKWRIAPWRERRRSRKTG